MLCLLARNAWATEVSLEWDLPKSSSNVVAYLIYSGTSSRHYQTATNVGISLKATLGGLDPSTRYYFTATSLNASGEESPYSNEVAVDTAPESEPPRILGLEDQVIRMNTSSDELAFHLVGGSSPATPDWLVSASASNPNLLPNSGLVLSGTGTYRSLQIQPARDEYGSSYVTVQVTDRVVTNSIVLLVTVLSGNLPPAVDAGSGTTVLTNLTHLLRGTITDDGLPTLPGKLSVRWWKVSGPGEALFVDATAESTPVRFTVPGIYRLRLTAFDGELSGTNDLVVRAQGTADSTPPAIEGLSVSDVTDTTLTVQWSTDEVADDQLEYTAQNATPSFTSLNPIPRLFHSLSLTNLQPGTWYTIKAHSHDASGNPSISDTLTISTLRSTYVYLSAHPDTTDESVPEGYTYDRDDQPTENQESVTFTLLPPLSDHYYTWVRVQSPSNVYAAFRVTWDSTPTDWFDPPGGAWMEDPHWILLNGRDGLVPFTLDPRITRLDAGSHLLTFSGSEVSSSLTRVLITNDPDFVPSDTSTLCCNPTEDHDSVAISMWIRNGWSMVSCPLSVPNTQISSLLPNPPIGTSYHQYDIVSGNYLPNVFEGDQWDLADMTLGPGEGGLLYNPGDAFRWIVLGGLVSEPLPKAETLQAGANFISFRSPQAGLLTKVLEGFSFRAGDTVQRADSDNGTYLTHTFDGTRWDRIPILNIGEALFITLVPRVTSP